MKLRTPEQRATLREIDTGLAMAGATYRYAVENFNGEAATVAMARIDRLLDARNELAKATR